MPPATTRDDGSITTEGSGSLRSTHTQWVLCHPGKNLLRGHTTAKMVFTKKVSHLKSRINKGDVIGAFKCLQAEVDN